VEAAAEDPTDQSAHLIATSEGYLDLLRAATFVHAQVAEVLVAMGADPDALDATTPVTEWLDRHVGDGTPVGT